MNNLQEIINKRAEDRAKAEVDNICKSIREMPAELSELIAKVKVETGVTEEGVHEYSSLRSLFWNSTGHGFTKNLVAELTLKYIPEESAKFVNQVESLQSQIDDLHYGN